MLDMYCGRKYKYNGSSIFSVPAEVLCDQTIWLEWLQHLVTSKGADGFAEYKGGTICGYLRRDLWTLRETHGKQGSTHEQFFQVLSAASVLCAAFRLSICCVSVVSRLCAVLYSHFVAAARPPTRS